MKLPKILGKSAKKLKYLPNNLKRRVKVLLSKIDGEDKKAIMSFISDVVINGLMLNIALYSFGFVPLTLFSWVGFGFAMRIVEGKIIKWIRLLRWK